jgi:hypothetical protein
MTTTNTGSYSRIRYFTSLLERMGEASRGGRANTISNAYSSILGGSGNTVSHSHAAAFGCNVSSVAPNTFHANNFVAQNMPTVSGGPSGTFYKTTVGLICVVAINP